jgi:predicted amidohydrolase
VGRLIRFAISVLVLWAVWHAGAAQWQQFQFQDEVKQIAQFGADRDEETVRAAVMDAAARLRVPITADRVQVRRQNDRIYIDAAYTAQIEILPRYRISWLFTASAEGWFVPGGRFPTRR